MRARLMILVLTTSLYIGCSREEAAPARSAPPDLASGAAASKAACSLCHLYPEPSLLEARAWPGVLNRMKLLSGLEQPDAQRMNNPELAGNTNIFPAQPLFSMDVWHSIEAFYLAKAPEHQPKQNRPPLPITLSLFKPERLAFSIPAPTTTFVSINEPTRSVLFADAKTEMLYSVQNDGSRQWSLPVSNIVTSVRLVDGLRYIVGIGDFFPSDDPFGEVLLYNPNAVGPPVTTLLTGLPRATHVEPADFNGDGKMDFALSIFGNLLGRFSWFERIAGGYTEHVLFDKPGALKSAARDFNADGAPDLAVLVAQATEALMIYTNLGNGKFATPPMEVFRKPPTYGHTDFEIADMNHDGRADFIVASGDNADFQTEPRPYHGIRIYLAEGSSYREGYFFPFYGVYRVLARDFDGDGDQDIAALSFFPDYTAAQPEAFVYLENKGDLNFEPATFADANIGRWLAMDAGDLDGDGDLDLALGALAEMPDRSPPRLKEYWRQQSPSVLLLRNQGR